VAEEVNSSPEATPSGGVTTQEAGDAQARAQPAQEQPAPSESESVSELEQELDGQLRRALADLDNLRKRYEREVTRERSDERARVASSWLPMVDDLERTLEHAEADPEVLITGVRSVLDQALQLLDRLGFPRFDDTGTVFDPARHEAVGAVEGGERPGTVVAVVRPGYGAGDALLRPAGVVVARGPA
jgi:molecular chaperone GrpE